MRRFCGIAWKTLLFLALCSSAFADTTPAEMRRMSVFLSNFTEAGFFNFRVGDYGNEDAMDLTDRESTPDLIHFGIRHNYINNIKSRIKSCGDKNCPYGALTLDGKFVVEAVRKYFDIALRDMNIPEDDWGIHYDGKLYHFGGADGEATYYAEVKGVSQKGKVVTLTGDIYNAEDKSERPGTFTATAKPYKWAGKDTWAILSLETEWNDDGI